MKFWCLLVRFTIKYTLEDPNMQRWYSIQDGKGNKSTAKHEVAAHFVSANVIC